jgi:hypothetical protein
VARKPSPGSLKRLGVEHDREREQEDGIADGSPDAVSTASRDWPFMSGGAPPRRVADDAQWRRLDRSSTIERTWSSNG